MLTITGIAGVGCGPIAIARIGSLQTILKTDITTRMSLPKLTA